MDKHNDRQVYKWTNKMMDNSRMGSYTNGQTEGWTHSKMDKQMDGQSKEWTNRRIGRYTNGQTK